VIWRQFN